MTNEETRNPNQAQSPNDETPLLGFGHWDLIRISGLVIRI